MIRSIGKFGRFEVLTNGSRFAVMAEGSAPEAISWSKRYSYGNEAAAVLMAQYAARQETADAEAGAFFRLKG